MHNAPKGFIPAVLSRGHPCRSVWRARLTILETVVSLTEQEQQIWQECSRLITTCIIFYNATILSNLLAYRQSIGDIEGAAHPKKVSPVACQNINFHGRYEFTKNTDPIDMREIIRALANRSTNAFQAA